MTGDLAPRDDRAPAVIGANDGQVSDLTAERLRKAVRPNTQRARDAAIGKFTDWCDTHGRVALPATPETLTEYVSHLTESMSPASIEQAIGLIRGWHKRNRYAGQPATTDALDLLREHRRTVGGQQRQAPPLTPADVRAMIDALDVETFTGRRDQLVFVLGFLMMARRSELAALTFGDVTETPDGLDVWVASSKTDKNAEGDVRSLPPQGDREVCPLRVFAAWRDMLGDDVEPGAPLLRRMNRGGRPSGPLSGYAINTIVRDGAIRANLPDAELYTAHSLRAGGLTDALQRGVVPGIAARHGGWKPESPMLGKYGRRARKWRDNAMRNAL